MDEVLKRLTITDVLSSSETGKGKKGSGGENHSTWRIVMS